MQAASTPPSAVGADSKVQPIQKETPSRRWRRPRRPPRRWSLTSPLKQKNTDPEVLSPRGQKEEGEAQGHRQHAVDEKIQNGVSASSRRRP